jgi:hypothetical protein
MTDVHTQRVRMEMSASGPRVVVCGTFRRAHEQLARDFAALLALGCDVLSPTDIEFVAGGHDLAART